MTPFLDEVQLEIVCVGLLKGLEQGYGIGLADSRPVRSSLFG
jgi:hypothetical protein